MKHKQDYKPFTASLRNVQKLGQKVFPKKWTDTADYIRQYCEMNGLKYV